MNTSPICYHSRGFRPFLYRRIPIPTKRHFNRPRQLKHSAGYMPVLKVFGFSMPACRFISPPATFDALDGFDERIRAKEEAYTERKELDEGEKEELNRKLCYLHTLTINGRLARQNRPTVAITYFSPCTDIENDWYGCGGQYKTITMLPPSIPWSGDLRIRGKGDSLSSTAAWKPPVSGRSGRRAGRGAAASSPAAITSSGNTT